METLMQTARTVVGPDEPLEGRSYEEGAALHWAYLAGIAQAQGVPVEAGELASLPHDVDISSRIRARLTDVRSPDDLALMSKSARFINRRANPKK
ncbi:hypothetical protein [Kineococcus rubinsiae]|uniref:hypothetical protein n=1 Tax=Kineococcus rubinsiae TaxID=2609562 RepID=UPI001AD8CD26|nr:hypothetical protein [Kineococcus rubinsiae]